MEFGCKFNLTPIRHKDEKGRNGDLYIIANEERLPFECDRRKLFMNLCKPTKEELENIIPIILVFPRECKLFESRCISNQIAQG